MESSSNKTTKNTKGEFKEMDKSDHLDYHLKLHEDRITRLEDNVTKVIEQQSSMITQQARTNDKLDAISKQLDNGIKSKLNALDLNMLKILPIIENRIDLDRTIRNAIIILACGGACTLLIFILKLFFK